MMTQAEWLAINEQRASIYQWFGSLFALEQTKEQLECYQNHQLDNLYAVFTELGLSTEVNRFQKAMNNALQDDSVVLELAADFAQHFLLDDKVSTLPYASFYLEDGKLYGDVETKMKEFLESNQLTISENFKEPADHLVIYLYLFAYWIRRSNDVNDQVTVSKEQSIFLENGLLNWLPEFVEKSQKQKLKYDVYPSLSALLLAFIKIDLLLLKE